MTPTTKPAGGDLDVTAADVAAAAADAAKAEELAASLERQIVDGDETITADQLAAQKSLGVFARLRADAVARKHEKAKTAARLAACTALHDEINAYGDSVGDELANLLQACHDANAAFASAVAEHNARVQAWRRRMDELGVPEDSSPMPSGAHGRLAIATGTGQVRAGLLQFGMLDAKGWTARAADEPHNADALVESIRGHVVYRHPGPDAGLHYYVPQTGGLAIGYGKPYSAEELKRIGLRKCTEAEVWER